MSAAASAAATRFAAPATRPLRHALGAILLLTCAWLVGAPAALLRGAIAWSLVDVLGGHFRLAAVAALAAGLVPVLRGLGALCLDVGPGPYLRWALRLRRPTGEQRQRLIAAFAVLADAGARPPRLVYVTRLPSPNAFVLGGAVVVDEALIDDAALPAILAHELGHLAARDGRLALALRWSRCDALAQVANLLDGRRLRHAAARLAARFPPLLPLALALYLAGLVLTGARLTLRLASGTALTPAWRATSLRRELIADAFAAQLGDATDLCEHGRRDEPTPEVRGVLRPRDVTTFALL